MRNWKTTAFGVIAGLSLILGQASTLLDADPETMPAWSHIVEGLGLLGIGIFAKDSSTKN
jgi:hypothetical protein